MAYSDPSTRATDDVVTAAIWNQDVVANPEFLHDPPTCRVYNSAAISISDGVVTALTFNSERYDTDTMHSTVTNTSRITATTAGKYLITATIGFAANNTGRRQVTIRLNGTTYIAVDARATVGNGQVTEVSIATVYALAAADYAEVTVFQDTGGSLNVSAASAYTPELTATWLSG